LSRLVIVARRPAALARVGQPEPAEVSAIGLSMDQLRTRMLENRPEIVAQSKIEIARSQLDPGNLTKRFYRFTFP
jgi:hypothetical protein